MSDAEKLRMLVQWFDTQQKLGRWPESQSREVQSDLLLIAATIEDLGSVWEMAKTMKAGFSLF